MQGASQVARPGASPDGLPVLGMQSASLRSPSSVGPRGPATAQRKPEPGPLAAAALGRAARTGGAVGASFPLIPPVRFPPIGPAGVARGDAPPFAGMMDAVARQVGLDRALLAAVVEAESSFKPGAVSRAGAKGLMQLMDSTALALGVVNPFDPQQNLLGGARFLRGLLDRYGQSLPLALAAYNAGPGAVDRYGGIPPFAETQTYVPRVLANLQRYRAMSWGRDRTVAS